MEKLKIPIRSFYAKVWNEKDEYYIKYKFNHRDKDNQGELYYIAECNSDEKKILKKLHIDRCCIWIDYNHPESLLDALHKIRFIDIEGTYLNAGIISHLFYDSGDPLGRNECYKNATRFKYIGQFETLSLEEAKLLSICDVDEE